MAVVCACIVALSHVGYNTAAGSAAWWFVRLSRYGLCCLAVPFFFAVSGYFLSRHFDESGWWLRETKKRVVSLLVPYLFWCLAFFLFMRIGSAMTQATAGKSFWAALRFPVAKLPVAFGLRLEATPLLVPTWYIRALFILVLVSPVVAWLASCRGKWCWFLSVAASFCLYVAFSPHRNGLASTTAEHFLYYGFSLMGIAYFLTGVVLRKTGFLEKTLDGARWLGVAMFAAGFAVLVWRVSGIAATGGEPFPVLCLAIPLLVAGVWFVVPSAPWPRWLTSMSFPIYVMHFFVIYAMDGFGGARADKSVSAMLSQAVISVMVPCAIALAMRRFAPRIAAFLFGGR